MRVWLRFLLLGEQNAAYWQVVALGDRVSKRILRRVLKEGEDG